MDLESCKGSRGSGATQPHPKKAARQGPGVDTELTVGLVPESGQG